MRRLLPRTRMMRLAAAPGRIDLGDIKALAAQAVHRLADVAGIHGSLAAAPAGSQAL